jgi:multidrug efflux system membrane fusion protein
MSELGRTEPQATRPPRRWVGWVLWLIFLGILGGGGYLLWRWSAKASAKPPPGEPPAVRVVAQQARKGDLPEFIDALGTVTSLATVTVRSRVDGELTKVAFTEGMTVKKDDLLAEIDPRAFQVALAQAKAQLEKDQATLNEAKIDLQRYEEAREAVPQQQIDTARAMVAQLAGAVAVDQAQIENAQLQLSYCTITAPVGGRVGLRMVDPGNLIHATDPAGLVVIAPVQPITVQFSVPQDDLPRVLKAQAQGQPRVDAYSRDLKTKLDSGQLFAIDSQIDPASGTCRMKAQFANENLTLFPNQFVNVRVLVNTEVGVILAPVASVQRGPQGTFVYVVKQDQTVEVRPITTGPQEADTVVIAKGLNDGDTVVTDGTDKLRNGSKVTVGGGAQPGTGSAPSGRGGKSGGSRQGGSQRGGG